VSKGVIIIIKGQRLSRNIYRMLGIIFIGRAVIIESRTDKTFLWHKQVSHMDEREMMEIHKKNLLKAVKTYKLDFYRY
jgi:hypothetical protein